MEAIEAKRQGDDIQTAGNVLKNETTESNLISSKNLFQKWREHAHTNMSNWFFTKAQKLLYSIRKEPFQNMVLEKPDMQRQNRNLNPNPQDMQNLMHSG